MDDYTDKTYQGTGFSGERMGATQTPPYSPSPMEPPAQPSPAQAPVTSASDITSTVPRDRTIWDEPQGPDQGEMKGLMVQGFLLGFFLGLIGIAGIALLSTSEKKGDRLMGSVIGIVVNIICTILLLAVA